ncbi:MAG TPA: hydroxyacylglutathione hydrolase, partial [Gammaproteobacteria bacterium]|nr:hydroxyacylglutathione hydrolase [Gammaproteobacteria bacterium]
IGDERSINAFFRLGSEEIRQNLALDQANDEMTFLALRKRRNDW